jgi:hypothetical protein
MSHKYLTKLFTYDHLNDDQFKHASKLVCDAAKALALYLPDNPITERVLFTLMEAKNLAIISILKKRDDDKLSQETSQFIKGLVEKLEEGDDEECGCCGQEDEECGCCGQEDECDK